MTSQTEPGQGQGVSLGEFELLRDEAFKLLDEDDQDPLENYQGLYEEACAAMKNTYGEFNHICKSKSLDEALKSFSGGRRSHISKCLHLKSFVVDFKYEKGDKFVKLKFASLAKEPLPFAPPVLTLTTDNLLENRKLLIARILLEIFMLPLDIIGLVSDPSEVAKHKAIEKILEIVEHADVITSVDEMARAVQTANALDIAKAILKCILTLFKSIPTLSFGVAKALLSDTPWYKVPILLAKLAFFVATLGGAGLGMLAKFISYLEKTAFISKFAQLLEFDTLPIEILLRPKSTTQDSKPEQ